MESLFNREHFQNAVLLKCNEESKLEKKKLGVREIAKKAGVSFSTINRIQRGRTPDIETFFRLCEWMERPPREFIKEKL